MKFRYKKVPDLAHPTNKWVSRPYLLVTLFYGTNKRPVLSLVDSGADYCLFHSSVADELGIDLESGWIKEFGGIAAGEPVQAYMHTIQIEIQGFGERVEIEAGFADSDAIGGLLGGVGFLDNYKVTLEKYKGRFQIESRPVRERS
jgi:predicted aspartyl protease